MLIILGVMMMLVTGFNVITQKQIVDLGPIQINEKEKHPVQWSPIIGAILLTSGVVIYLTNKKKN